MQRLLLFLFFSILALSSLAQVDTDPVDAASTGMGHAVVTVESAWAGFYNIGNVAQVEKLTIGASYKQRFRTEGFNTIAAVIAQPLKKGVIAAGINRFGDQLFNTQVLFLGYAYHLGGVNLGLKANYLQYTASEYGTKGVIAVDFGVNTQLSEYFFLGASFFNINQAKLNEFEDERVPSLLRIGLSYRTNEKVMVNVDAEKDLDLDPIARVGISYDFVEYFTGRIGFAHDPSIIYAGLGLQYGIFQLDYAFQTHPNLPNSHTISITTTPFQRKGKTLEN